MRESRGTHDVILVSENPISITMSFPVLHLRQSVTHDIRWTIQESSERIVGVSQFVSRVIEGRDRLEEVGNVGSRGESSCSHPSETSVKRFLCRFERTIRISAPKPSRSAERAESLRKKHHSKPYNTATSLFVLTTTLPSGSRLN